MIRLIKLGESGMFDVESPDMGVSIMGTDTECLEVLESLGVEMREARMAFNALEDNDHNVAEFGVNRCFIYSAMEPDAAAEVA